MIKFDTSFVSFLFLFMMLLRMLFLNLLLLSPHSLIGINITSIILNLRLNNIFLFNIISLITMHNVRLLLLLVLLLLILLNISSLLRFTLNILKHISDHLFIRWQYALVHFLFNISIISFVLYCFLWLLLRFISFYNFSSISISLNLLVVNLIVEPIFKGINDYFLWCFNALLYYISTLIWV